MLIIVAFAPERLPCVNSPQAPHVLRTCVKSPMDAIYSANSQGGREVRTAFKIKEKHVRSDISRARCAAPGLSSQCVRGIARRAEGPMATGADKIHCVWNVEYGMSSC